MSLCGSTGAVSKRVEAALGVLSRRAARRSGGVILGWTAYDSRRLSSLRHAGDLALATCFVSAEVTRNALQALDPPRGSRTRAGLRCGLASRRSLVLVDVSSLRAVRPIRGTAAAQRVRLFKGSCRVL